MSASLSTAKLLLRKWAASLSGRDRSMKSVETNFDDLFNEWFCSGVQFDDAYSLLDDAIKSHYPNANVSRAVYKNFKSTNKTDLTEKEFIVSWQKKIYDLGTQSFFNWYKVEAPETEQPFVPKTVQFGSMSEAEYKRQRSFADSFPEVDISKIKDQVVEVDIEEEEPGE